VFLFPYTDDFWRYFNSSTAKGIVFIRDPKGSSRTTGLDPLLSSVAVGYRDSQKNRNCSINGSLWEGGCGSVILANLSCRSSLPQEYPKGIFQPSIALPPVFEITLVGISVKEGVEVVKSTVLEDPI